VQIVDVKIFGRTGDNREPASGDVRFSDGGHYSFHRDHVAGGWRFGSFRRRHGVTEMFSFRSSKREALLNTYLNT